MEASLVAQRSNEAFSHEESLSPNLSSSIPNPFPMEALRLQNSQRPIRTSAVQQRQMERVRQAQSVAVPIVDSEPTNSAEDLTVVQDELSRTSEESTLSVDENLLPSLHHLQQSCLTALNNLFSQDDKQQEELPRTPATPSSPWCHIVPTRRHSLPDAGGASSSAVLSSLISTTLNPLQTLVSNLRSYDDQLVSVDEDCTLMQELDRRVSKLAPIMLDATGAELALSLAKLLSDVDNLSSLPSTSAMSSAHVLAAEPPEQGSDVYDTLSRRVQNLQSQRTDSRTGTAEDGPFDGGSSSKMQKNALWSRIDEELETVLSRCRHRANRDVHVHPSETAPFYVTDNNLPPEYDRADYEDNHPPEYDPFSDPYDMYYTKPKMKSATQHPEASMAADTATSEKMRLDLESVAMAIDRLYLVAPQLHNQRVELKKSKLQQMDAARRIVSDDITVNRAILEAESAKLVGRGRIVDQTAELPRFRTKLSGKIDLKGKGKAVDPLDKIKRDELEKMVDLIGKTSNEQRRISDQRVEFGDMNARIERARRRQEQKKEALVEQMLKHSGAGRLSSQDATPSRTSALFRLLHPDPEALLSLPEFIREALPPNTEAKTLDPETMLTLPEFFQEQHLHDPEAVPDNHDDRHSPTSISLSRKASKNDITSSSGSGSRHPSVSRIRNFATKRNRSNSAPPLALSWFKPAKSVAHSTSSTEQSSLLKGSSPRNSDVGASQEKLQVLYVAEYQQNLHSVIMFLRLGNVGCTVSDVEVEVLMNQDADIAGSDRFVVSCGSSYQSSEPLSLPVKVLPGRQEVRVIGNYCEIKLVTPPLSPSPDGPQLHNGSLALNPPNLLDAEQLTNISPTSFICASCSLPVVHCGNRSLTYVDLPSEHWAELLDAWMCHSDQKLTAAVAKHSQHGFWPEEGRALVGASYILFNEDVIASSASKRNNEGVQHGIEDWQTTKCLCGATLGRHQRPKDSDSTTYRLAKYSIRPVSLIAPPARIPLSAYITADMIEVQQAHAVHRFILKDEEEERPRLLMWLFNPSVMLSFQSAKQYTLPSDSPVLHVAKVLFFIVGPDFSVGPGNRGLFEKYPSFGNSETLMYPLDLCTRLAAMLKESNLTYPEERRTMAQLDVGYLQRS